MFSSRWNVPLETVPQGLFSPPTLGRTVINTATNARAANWQRECNTSRCSNRIGPIAFPSCLPFGLFGFRSHPTGAFLKTCQWLLFVFWAEEFHTRRRRRCATGCCAGFPLPAAPGRQVVAWGRAGTCRRRRGPGLGLRSPRARQVKPACRVCRSCRDVPPALAAARSAAGCGARPEGPADRRRDPSGAACRGCGGRAGAASRFPRACKSRISVARVVCKRHPRCGPGPRLGLHVGPWRSAPESESAL